MLRLVLIGFFCLCAGLSQAQTQKQVVNLDALKVGDVLPQDGEYWDLQGDVPGQINLRFIGTKLRLYYLDPEGKIMEPVYPVALVRYRSDLQSWKTNAPQMTKLTAGPGNVYLASERVLQQPLRYLVWVIIKRPAENSKDEDESVAYAQRILSGIGTSAN